MIWNKNPNFFKNSATVSEPEVHVLMKEDTDTENEIKRNQTGISPSKGLNFYKEDDLKNMEDTPDFQDSDQKYNQEIEKPVEFSNEKSDEKQRKFAKNIMKFDMNDEEEDQEEFQDSKEIVQVKQRKHKFNSEFNQEPTNDKNMMNEGKQKVEETPEKQEVTGEFEEPHFVVKEIPRGSQQRKYKAWERSDYKSKLFWDTNSIIEIEREPVDPEKEYNTIAERIRNRNRNKDIEYQDDKTKDIEPPIVENRNDSPFVKNLSETSDAIAKSSNQMMNRLQSLKEQWSNIENSMEIMMEQSKSLYSEQKPKQDKIRNTVNLQTTNYMYAKDNMIPKREEEYQYTKSNVSQNHLKDSPSVKISLYDNKPK